MSLQKTLRFQVEENARKLRLEDFLLGKLQGFSKMYLRDLIKGEKCQVNGGFENRGYRLRANDFVELEIDRRVEPSMRPEFIPLEILFEDREIIVIDKPAGMLMHPTFVQKKGTLLNALAYYLNQESTVQIHEGAGHKTAAKESSFIRPGLVHRLDRETSGLIVVAKTARAHRILADHFKRKLVGKKYFALVEGVVEENSGKIIAPIGRDAEIKLWKVTEEGKYAETHFWVRQRFRDNRTLLELEPITGRTNQLRVHCAHIGHSIVGDFLYGSGQKDSRLCLHAYKLSFWHPSGERRMEFETANADCLFSQEL